MRIIFTDQADADCNEDIIRAIAEANARRSRSDRSVKIKPRGSNSARPIAFNLEDLNANYYLVGVVEDKKHGPLPGKFPLDQVKSITIEGV